MVEYEVENICLNRYITNKYDSIRLPYSLDLLDWLVKTYPNSQYIAVEYESD